MQYINNILIEYETCHPTRPKSKYESNTTKNFPSNWIYYRGFPFVFSMNVDVTKVVIVVRLSRLLVNVEKAPGCRFAHT